MSTDIILNNTVINQLTETQLASATIQPNQFWCTPDEETDDTKANVDLSNVTYPVNTLGSTAIGSGDRVIETYISEDGLKWYRIWASGWKECGGIASRGVSVSYGITFTKEPTLILTYKYQSGTHITGPDTPIKVTSSSTLSSFSWGTGHSYTPNACYYACGY